MIDFTPILLDGATKLRVRGGDAPTDIFIGFETEKDMIEWMSALTPIALRSSSTNPTSIEGSIVYGMRVHVLKNRPKALWIGNSIALDL